MVIEHVNIELMIADPLTKGMPPSKFKDHIDHMGLSLLVLFYCIRQCMKLYFSYDISHYVLCAYSVICLRNVIKVWTKNKHRVYSLRYVGDYYKT